MTSDPKYLETARQIVAGELRLVNAEVSPGQWSKAQEIVGKVLEASNETYVHPNLLYGLCKGIADGLDEYFDKGVKFAGGVVVGNKKEPNCQHGFDTTHFGYADNWLALCREIGLQFVGPIKTAEGVKGFAWSNERGLAVVTQNNPETGEYAPGNREVDPGFASYIGAEGPAYEVANFAAAVRRYADSIKDERAGSRDFI